MFVPDRSRPAIIAIGASAGGFDELPVILGLLPKDLDASVLVVLHRAFGVPSFLREMLAERSPMRMVEAVQGEELLAGVCYLGLPATHLSMGDAGHARMTPDPLRLRRGRTVDHLFLSVALHAGPRAIGVVLSGMLDDGAAGLAAIEAAGGRAMVQLPGKAAFSGMPQSAVDAGTAMALVASTAGLGRAIADLVPADATVARAELIVTRQLRVIAIMAGARMDTARAEGVLRTVRGDLALLRSRRRDLPGGRER
jgi:two-component system, chemotaxis family, protein-glutamate methylesterase/glutaminase